MNNEEEIDTIYLDLSDGEVIEIKEIKAGPGEEYDYEGYMIRTQLRKMSAQAMELLSMVKDDEQFPSWMQTKMTLATEYLDGIYDFYKYSDYTISTVVDNDSDDDSDTEED